MMLRVFGYVCLTVICSAILGTAGVLGWFLADRELPSEVLSSEVLTPRVRPGDRLIIRQRVNYKRDCSAHVDRALYDQSATASELPSEQADVRREFLRDIDYDHPPLGLGKKTIVFDEEVPLTFKPGPAEYRAVPSYACNFVHRFYWPITRPVTILRFEVVE
jgi:hypothetical protein